MRRFALNAGGNWWNQCANYHCCARSLRKRREDQGNKETGKNPGNKEPGNKEPNATRYNWREILRLGRRDRRSRSRKCAGTICIGGASLWWKNYKKRSRRSRCRNGWRQRRRYNLGKRLKYNCELRDRFQCGKCSRYWTRTYTRKLALCKLEPVSPQGD